MAKTDDPDPLPLRESAARQVPPARRNQTETQARRKTDDPERRDDWVITDWASI